MDTIAPANASPALRVLLVEDSHDDAELLGFELSDQGYAATITRVDTPQDLASTLERGTWDVLLCDNALPEMDALSALSIVQNAGVDVPFIIVSHAISELSAVEVMRAGAHDYLFKHKLGRLGAVIEREMREAEVRAERRRMHQQLLLADRLSSLGMLAAGMAHEINNPLAYVLGNLEFALSRLTPQHAPEGSELVEIVQALTHAREGAERIGQTTRDLKVFCRRDDEPKSAVNIAKVMASSINMAWNQIRHRAKLTRNFERVPSVAGNQNRLGQVFLNLLVNAAQAIPDDRVDENEISVSISSHGGRVAIQVSDTGCGMTPEQMKRVFEPLFTTKPSGIGTGIGLSICHSIVTDLGGEIQVESQVGRGSSFRVLLPAQAGSAYTTLPPVAEPPAVPRARILVIDDEPSLCAVMRRLLRRQHEVVAFQDAREALTHLRQGAEFDVVFCDIMMPHMSGIDFFRALENLDADLATRTVFLTGGVFNAPTQQFLAQSPNLLLEKPFETRSLQGAIARLLESRVSSGTWHTRPIEAAM